MMPLAKGKIFALGNAFGLLFPFGKTVQLTWGKSPIGEAALASKTVKITRFYAYFIPAGILL